MIKYLLWDIDGTLLDFIPSERHSLKKAFSVFGLGECSDENCRLYSSINLKYWEMMERGEITKQRVLIGRFEEFLALNSITSVSATDFCRQYENGLTEVIAYIDNSLDLLRELSADYHQYIITNGALSVQRQKLEKSGIASVVDGVFISDEVGYEKPSPQFFEHVLTAAGIRSKSSALIIGDSLTSDMKGGINSGIPTCWYNPADAPKPDEVNYTIGNLWDIKSILSADKG